MVLRTSVLQMPAASASSHMIGALWADYAKDAAARGTMEGVAGIRVAPVGGARSTIKIGTLWLVQISWVVVRWSCADAL